MKKKKKEGEGLEYTSKQEKCIWEDLGSRPLASEFIFLSLNYFGTWQEGPNIIYKYQRFDSYKTKKYSKMKNIEYGWIDYLFPDWQRHASKTRGHKGISRANGHIAYIF